MAENNVVTVEEFARALADYSKAKDFYWSGALKHIGEAYKYYIQGTTPSHFNPDNDEKWPESFKLVVNKIKTMVRGSREEQDFLRISEMFRNITDGNSYDNASRLRSISDLLLALRKFKDQDLIYDVLRQTNYEHITNETEKRSKYKDLSKQYYDMLGSNKNATADDICERMFYCKSVDEARDIVSGVFNKVEADITAELSRDFPDKSKIQDGARVAGRVVQILEDMAIRFGDTELQKSFGNDREALKRFEQEVLEYKKQVEEKYNADRIYEENNPLVIKKFDENLSVRISEVQARNERLEKENTNLVQVNDQLREKNKAEKEAHKAEKDSLEQQLTDEKAARQAAEALLRKAKELIDAFDKSEETIGKAGMFNKGAVKVQMKQKIDDARNALWRAEEEELKRKRELAQRTGQYEI